MGKERKDTARSVCRGVEEKFTESSWTYHVLFYLGRTAIVCVCREIRERVPDPSTEQPQSSVAVGIASDKMFFSRAEWK